MKRVLMTSRSLHVFVCVSLMIVLHASSITSSGATPVNSNSMIRIWIVGSPHTNALPAAVIPPELRQRAESLGYNIEIKAFRPNGFAEQFHQALQNHNEPEVLTFENYGVISGIKTRTGWVDGIDWDRQTASSLALVHETMASLQPRGWVMLVRSAVNYEAARALAMQSPECDAGAVREASPSTSELALREAQEQAVLATRAYIDCDQSALTAVSDESLLVQQCYLPQSNSKAESVKVCSVSGNQKLAFVSLVSGFSAEVRDPRALIPSKQGVDLGQQSILAILRNQSGTWRLLAISHDRLINIAGTPANITRLANSLDQWPTTAMTLEPARLLTPNGVYPAPQRGERFGDFIWQPSQSTEVIGQVVEFMWGKETNWGLTRLFFLPANESKISSGQLMSGGRTLWRVWSINRSGDVVFSAQHAFKHCPCPSLCYDF